MDAALAETEPALALRRLVRFDPGLATEVGDDDFLFDAPGAESVAAECAGLILASGDETRARTLLAAGASCVLLGELALVDSEAVGRLVQEHAGRVGVYVPAQRLAVSWSFETTSNADFKTVTPSFCEPAWEALRADGASTGTLLSWWLKAMRELGASRYLVQADVQDDTDLDILAGLIEELGDALWIAPRSRDHLPLADWISYGQCRLLALPTDLFARRAELFE